MRILDLFCGAGGASMGMHYQYPDAEIIGVDLMPQAHYPFEFHQADATTYPLDGFDLIWASPPCQAYARTRSLPGRSVSKHPPLIEPTRERLVAAGIPWIMENVERAPMPNAITLCGLMFGLRVYRHRLFEASFPITAPPHIKHIETIAGHRAGYYGNGVGDMVTVAGHLFSKAAGQYAMQIDWMTCYEMAQSVPPAYAKYVSSFFDLGRTYSGH